MLGSTSNDSGSNSSRDSGESKAESGGSSGSPKDSVKKLFDNYQAVLGFFIYDACSADRFIEFYSEFINMIIDEKLSKGRESRGEGSGDGDKDKKDDKGEDGGDDVEKMIEEYFDNFRVYIASPLIYVSGNPVWPVSILDDHAIYRGGDKFECLVPSYMSCWKTYGFPILVLVKKPKKDDKKSRDVYEEIVGYIKQALSKVLNCGCSKPDSCECCSSSLAYSLLNKYILFIPYPYLMKITCSHNDAKSKLIDVVKKLQESIKNVFIVTAQCTNIIDIFELLRNKDKVKIDRARKEDKYISSIEGRLVSQEESALYKLYNGINKIYEKIKEIKLEKQKIDVEFIEINIACKGNTSVLLKSLDEIFEKNEKGKPIIKIEKPVERYLDECLGTYIDGEVYIEIADSVKKEEKS